ncbi:ABC transporter ATP-binding protein [Chloroflexota bacterium]
MKAIEVQALERTFKKIRALKGIDFSVDSGEIFSFLGPNGAGKTTTIRILTGQLRPTAGSARVVGYDVVSERQALKPAIGVVFEHQNLYERLSATDNLNFAARLYGVDRRRVVEVLEQVGLEDRAKERLKNYSNGMKQRLLIARALLHEPQVIFMDEPTRGLDPHMSRSVRKIISDLAGQGTTIFLTTHYMEEADQLSDRVAFIDQGRIVALAPPETLKAGLGDEGATLEDAFIQMTGKDLYQ